MAGIFQHVHGVLFKTRQVPFPHRTVKLAGLTESASSDTAPLDFQNHPVLGNLNKRNHRLLGIISV